MESVKFRHEALRCILQNLRTDVQRNAVGYPQFRHALTEVHHEFKDAEAICAEIFRILFNRKDLKDPSLCLQEIESAIESLDKAVQHKQKADPNNETSKPSDGYLDLLELVWLGKTPAKESFLDGKYRVHLLQKQDKIYRVGNSSPGKDLGQYWTLEKPPDLGSVRKSCAIKDDWSTGGVTLDEVFAPSINAVYTFCVTTDIVAFEGTAAPLSSFMKADKLASTIFTGGGNQLFIVRPWDIRGRLQPVSQEPLHGDPWTTLGYDATPLCKAAYCGTIEPHAARLAASGALDAASGWKILQELKLVEDITCEDIDYFEPRFQLTALHHACISRSPRPFTVRLLVACGADPARPGQGELTPLSIAIIAGAAATVAALLDAAAKSKVPAPAERMLRAEGQHSRTPLHFAALARHLNICSVCARPQQLAPSSEPNGACTKCGLSDVWGGYAEVVQRVVAYSASAGLSVDPVDGQGCTPLWVACHHGRAAAAAQLLAGGANPAHDLLTQDECFIAAAAAVEGAAAAGRPFREASNWDEDSHMFLNGTTPLHTAVQGGHPLVVKLVVEALEKARAGKQAPPPPRKGLDLLHRAVASYATAAAAGNEAEGKQRLEVVRLLAEHGDGIGLDLNTPRQYSRNEDSALHLAVIKGCPDAIRALLSANGAGVGRRGGVNPVPKNLQGWTPLHMAVARPPPALAIEMLKALLNPRAEPGPPPAHTDIVEARLADGTTALILAASMDQTGEIVETLLRHGADPCARDEMGYTALSRAAHAGNLTVVRLICAAARAHRANPHVPDINGWTPLHRAAHGGSAAVVTELLQMGADPRATARAGAGCSPAARRWAEALFGQGDKGTGGAEAAPPASRGNLTAGDVARTEEIRLLLEDAIASSSECVSAG